MENILFYIQQINFDFTISMIILLVILSIALLLVVFATTSPKFTILLAIAGIILACTWLVILALLLGGLLPIYEEDYLSCGFNCIGIYPVKIPTAFTKIVAVLPFLSIVLLIMSIISRRRLLKKKHSKKPSKD